MARVLRAKEGSTALIIYTHQRVVEAERELHAYYTWFDLEPVTAGEGEATQLIDRSTRIAVLHAFMAKAIQLKQTIHVRASLFAKPVASLCDGCTEQLLCIAESLSTPEKCVDSRHRYVAAVPTHLERSKVTLEVMQPRKTFVVPLWQLAEAQALEAW